MSFGVPSIAMGTPFSNSAAGLALTRALLTSPVSGLVLATLLVSKVATSTVSLNLALCLAFLRGGLVGFGSALFLSTLTTFLPLVSSPGPVTTVAASLS